MFSILFIYYIVTLLYLIIQYRKDDRNIIMKILIGLFCPLIGLLLLYFMFHQKKDEKHYLPDDLIKKGEETSEILSRVDVEKETNIVPVRDALLLNDNQTKRRVLMNVLKNETFNKIEILQTALQNEDTETSHYAAAAIQDTKGQLLKSIQQLEYEAERFPNEIERLAPYARVIKQYVNTGFLDDRTRKQYLYQYFQLLENMIELAPREKEYYIEIINCALELEELERAETYSHAFLKYCGAEEEAYFSSMKLYYKLKNQSKFHEILQMLRDSPVKLSPQGLNKIRFWLHGDKNGY
ncbi:hypothetical protein [Metabacillus fastidiosus]|uniref:hypothetical protein n=1 Tax=Metabacillus fastidiosus TaxID=1458 RepID=UPI002E1E226C|nr:hypothetical protein [Metabacillus fastidiosus]